MQLSHLVSLERVNLMLNLLNTILLLLAVLFIIHNVSNWVDIVIKEMRETRRANITVIDAVNELIRNQHHLINLVQDRSIVVSTKD